MLIAPLGHIQIRRLVQSLMHVFTMVGFFLSLLDYYRCPLSDLGVFKSLIGISSFISSRLNLKLSGNIFSVSASYSQYIRSRDRIRIQDFE